MRRTDAPFFAFRRARGGDADFREGDFLAEKDERRRFVVIQRAERTISAGEIRVVVSFTRRQQVRNLAVCAERGGASGFRDDQRIGPRQTVDGLPEL